MKINKQLLAAVAVTTIATGSIIGISATSAHQTKGENKDELVTKLAEKFNVDASEVESVFDEQRATMEAERDSKREEHLQTLVDEGKITAEQKIALEAKFAEMKSARDELKNQNLTRDEMHTKMEEGRVAFKAWAEEQGIDLDAIRPEGGLRFGPGGHGHHGPEDSTDSKSDL